MGWRYAPGQNGRKPCGCPACIARGGFKSRPLRDAYESDFLAVPYEDVLTRLRSADPSVVQEGIWELRRRGDPVADLAFLADHPDPEVREALGEAIAAYPVRPRNRWVRAGLPIADMAADEP